MQSGFYDPAIGRFIDADAYTSTGQGILGDNMFAYCRNNPISRKDASGTEDVNATDFNQDNNHANDLGNPTGSSGTGGKGNGKGVRGVGGKGWRGDQTWRQNVKTVADGGDVRNLNVGTPTIDEAKALIVEAQGVYRNFHPAHPVGGISTHTYNHIHYLTQTGIRSTIEVAVHF